MSQNSFFFCIAFTILIHFSSPKMASGDMELGAVRRRRATVGPTHSGVLPPEPDIPRPSVGLTHGGTRASRGRQRVEQGEFWSVLVRRDGWSDSSPLGCSQLDRGRNIADCHMVAFAKCRWALSREQGNHYDPIIPNPPQGRSILLQLNPFICFNL